MLLVGSSLTVLWIACFFSAVRASNYIGFWPKYGHPDPKTLPPEFWIHGWPFEYALPFIIGCVMAGLPAWLIVKKTPAFAWIPVAFLGMVLLILFGFLVLYLDPSGAVEWYFD